MKSLFMLGIAFMTISYLWLLFMAFKKGILWGLGCLFFPVIFLVLIVLEFKKAYKPIILYVVGMVAFFSVIIFSPESLPQSTCSLKRKAVYQASQEENESAEVTFDELYAEMFPGKNLE